MIEQINKPKRIAVTWAPTIEAAQIEGLKIAEAFRTFCVENSLYKDVFVETFSLYDPRFLAAVKALSYDLVITLGGDGTMLRTGKICAPYGIPVCGVNMGSFGFLMELQQDQWPGMIPSLLEGAWKNEERMLLHVNLTRANGEQQEWEVLNDAVVGRGMELRPVRLNVKVSGNLLTDYVADGLIVSSATGSTAYAMAAGGPILQPELRNLLVIPVAPHLSPDRGLVLQENEVVQISVTDGHDPILSADGGKGVVLQDGDRIFVSSSRFSARFVRFRDNGFFYKNFIQYMQRNPSAVRSKR